MSEVIEPYFGRTPILNKGDFVRLTDCDCCRGIIVSVDARYHEGDLRGQAREFTIAIANDEDTWDIESGYGIDDVVRVLTKADGLVEEKPGKVLQFEDRKVRVNGPDL